MWGNNFFLFTFWSFIGGKSWHRTWRWVWLWVALFSKPRGRLWWPPWWRGRSECSLANWHSGTPSVGQPPFSPWGCPPTGTHWPPITKAVQPCRRGLSCGWFLAHIPHTRLLTIKTPLSLKLAACISFGKKESLVSPPLSFLVHLICLFVPKFVWNTQFFTFHVGFDFTTYVSATIFSFSRWENFISA